MKTIVITSPAIQHDVLLRSALERINDLESELLKLRSNIAGPNKSIRIYQANRVITASPQDVLFIQSENNYSRLFFKNGVQYYTSRTLKSWTKELSASDFLRCHRTYLVNRSAVTEINRLKKEILLQGEIHIPTSRRFQKSCLSAIASGENENENHLPSSHTLVYSIAKGKQHGY